MKEYMGEELINGYYWLQFPNVPPFVAIIFLGEFYTLHNPSRPLPERFAYEKIIKPSPFTFSEEQTIRWHLNCHQPVEPGTYLIEKHTGTFCVVKFTNTTCSEQVEKYFYGVKRFAKIKEKEEVTVPQK